MLQMVLKMIMSKTNLFLSQSLCVCVCAYTVTCSGVCLYVSRRCVCSCGGTMSSCQSNPFACINEAIIELL